jgi:hypothetical protein
MDPAWQLAQNGFPCWDWYVSVSQSWQTSLFVSAW